MRERASERDGERERVPEIDRATERNKSIKEQQSPLSQIKRVTGRARVTERE